MKLTFTTEQTEALEAAKSHYNLTAETPLETVEEYVQFVMNGACESYRAQLIVETPENLKAKLALAEDLKAQAEVKAVEEQTRREVAEAKVATE